MPSRKNIAKSIRISEKLYDYINACPGNGFNEKLENVILEAKAGEIQRKQNIALLEKQIDNDRHELEVLFEKRRYLEEYFRILVHMGHELDKLQKNLEIVTNLDQTKDGGSNNGSV